MAATGSGATTGSGTPTCFSANDETDDSGEVDAAAAASRRSSERSASSTASTPPPSSSFPVTLSASDFFVGRAIGEEGAFGRVVHCKYKQRSWAGRQQLQQHEQRPLGQSSYNVSEARSPLKDVAVKVIDKSWLMRQQQRYEQLKRQQRSEEGEQDGDADVDDGPLQAVLKEQRLLSTTLRSGDDGEADNSQRASPRNVVRLLASFHDAHCLYMVLELASYGSLYDVLTTRRRKRQERGYQDSNDNGSQSKSWVRTVAYYSLQIIKGLEELHTRGIVHADLNPRNILVTDVEDGAHEGGDNDANKKPRGCGIRIADFNLAIEVDRVATRIKNNSINDRSASSMSPWSSRIIPDRGTADYTCPELLRRRHRCERTVATANNGTGDDSKESLLLLQLYAIDLWSFGCVLYAMLSEDGQSPFHADTDALAVQKILSFAGQCSGADAKDGKNTATCRCDSIFGDDHDSNFPSDWIVVISSLLDPDPQRRLGWQQQYSEAADTVDTRNCKILKWYYWTKRGELSHDAAPWSTAWKDVDLKRPPSDLVAPEFPTWYTAAEDMVDGSRGAWSAFLV